MSSNRCILVDGSGFIFRAYHSLPPLTRPDGTPVGAVYGFINMLLKLRDSMPATHLAVIFDAGRKTFRNELYPEYKANRPEPPEDLIPQFPLVREATRAMDLPAVELPGCEADDVIATYAKQASEQGMEVVIVSSDKDLMQLVSENVHLYDAMKNREIGREQVIEKFGVPPELVGDALALIGDTSDNIPGVPGIGPKTAAELITQFGSLEEVLARASEIKQNKRRESIEGNAEQARLSRVLVALKEDCEGIPPLSEFTTRPLSVDSFIEFLKEQGFKSLVTRMQVKQAEADVPEASFPRKRESKEKEYTLVTAEKELAEWIARAQSVGCVAFDVETNGLNARSCELAGFSLSVKPGVACYVPLNHKTLQAAQTDLFGASEGGKPVRIKGQLEEPEALALLKPLLEDASVLKIGQNIKFDALVMKARGIEIAPIDDTMLISYCLGAGKHGHGMDELSEMYLGIKPISYKEIVGSGKSQVTFDLVETDRARDYAAEDADVTLRLHHALKPLLVSEGMTRVYERLERPLVPVITRMEYHGVKVDRARLDALSLEFGKEIQRLEEVIHRLAGHEFTIGSPKQLGEVLFDEMGLPGGKKSSKSGAYATGAEILEDLAAAGHELPEKVLQWRQLSKLKSTYTDTLVQQIDPVTGRVHTSFSLAATSTGRLASSDPNVQNIPIRTEQGRKIREAFVAEEGYQLLSVDYSQIELRLLAHVADIGTLKEAFAQGRDIHATTASQMFGVPVEEVDSDLRRKAKTINFGIIYGISAHGLSTRLGIGRKEAAEYIERYFAQYPGIRSYMERMKEFAREKGYVETLWGRRCYIPGINDKNPNMRAFSERAAINAPLQGSAADIIKRAMIAVDKLLMEGGYKSRMLLQVHDELLFEIAAGEEEVLVEKVKRTMEQADHSGVILEVQAGLGSHWGEIH